MHTPGGERQARGAGLGLVMVSETECWGAKDGHAGIATPQGHRKRRTPWEEAEAEAVGRQHNGSSCPSFK